METEIQVIKANTPTITYCNNIVFSYFVLSNPSGACSPFSSVSPVVLRRVEGVHGGGEVVTIGEVRAGEAVVPLFGIRCFEGEVNVNVMKGSDEGSEGGELVEELTSVIRL